MKCPDEVANIFHETLAVALLRARFAGWMNNAAAAALEADHVHNIPTLLRRYSPDLLRYYVEAEKPGFIDACEEAAIDVNQFVPLWDRLDALWKQQRELD